MTAFNHSESNGEVGEYSKVDVITTVELHGMVLNKGGNKYIISNKYKYITIEF